MGKKKKIISILRFLGIALFVYFLFNVDLGNTLELLGKTKIFPFIIGFLFAIMVLVFKGIRWHYLNNGDKGRNSWSTSLYQFYDSYAIGVFTPGRVGELVKAGHEEGLEGKISSVLRMVAERGIDIGMFLLFACIGIILPYIEKVSDFVGWTVFIIAIGLIVTSMLLLSMDWVYELLSKLATKFLRKDVSFYRKKYSGKEISVIIGASLLSNISHFICVYFIALSLELDIAFWYLSSGIAISGILNLIPISVMGLGTREATFFYLFEHIDQSLLLALSGLILITAQIGGGVISLLASRIIKRFL
jgi:uncharacterized protein (TIRG00374 family)